MNKNNILEYLLADFGKCSPIIKVKLHRTPHGYWSFQMWPNVHLDMADRLFWQLTGLVGIDERILEMFNRIEYTGHSVPWISVDALYCEGKRFPSRESIEKFINEAFVPCWKQAIGKIMEVHKPGDTWLKVVMKAESLWVPDEVSATNRTAIRV